MPFSGPFNLEKYVFKLALAVTELDLDVKARALSRKKDWRRIILQVVAKALTKPKFISFTSRTVVSGWLTSRLDYGSTLTVLRENSSLLLSPTRAKFGMSRISTRVLGRIQRLLAVVFLFYVTSQNFFVRYHKHSIVSHSWKPRSYLSGLPGFFL